MKFTLKDLEDKIYELNQNPEPSIHVDPSGEGWLFIYFDPQRDVALENCMYRIVLNKKVTDPVFRVSSANIANPKTSGWWIDLLEKKIHFSNVLDRFLITIQETKAEFIPPEPFKKKDESFFETAKGIVSREELINLESEKLKKECEDRMWEDKANKSREAEVSGPMPWRLQIAANLVASHGPLFEDTDSGAIPFEGSGHTIKEVCQEALKWADELIKKHEETK